MLAEVEFWRPVVGFPRYEVSNLGRVRSLWFRNGKTDRLRLVPKILRYGMKGQPGREYRFISIGKHCQRYVHALVLEAFVGPRPAGLEAGHQDGERFNNRASNLAWITTTENNRQRRRDGTMPMGDKSPTRKLRNWQTILMRRLRSHFGIVELGRMFGVSHPHVSKICLGKVWA